MLASFSIRLLMQHSGLESFQFLRRGGFAEQVFLEVLIDVAEEMFYHVPCRVGHVRQVGVACGTGVGGVYFELIVDAERGQYLVQVFG